MAEVGCAGILVADTFCGPMAVLPPAGQLLAMDAMPSAAGGCAANVANDLARQGVEADVVGCLGNDVAANIVISGLEEYGVDCRQISKTDDYPTSQTVILLIEGEDRRYLHVFGANRAFSINQIDRDWVASLKLFYLGGLFVLPGVQIDALHELLEFCHAKNVMTVVDVVVPQGMSDFGGVERCMPFIDYFLPNDDEAALLTGRSEPTEQLRVLRDWGAGTAIVTLGEQGLIAAKGNDMWRAGVYKLPMVDPSGCGDAFCAGLIVGALGGWSTPQLLQYATALGASAGQAVGCSAGVFTAEQAEAFVRENELQFEQETL